MQFKRRKDLITPLSVPTFSIFKNRILDLLFSSIAHGTYSWVSIYWMDLDLGTDLWNQERGEFFRLPSQFCTLI